ncbi:hypothetical protein ACJX0J_008928, partial [Zea mays]
NCIMLSQYHNAIYSKQQKYLIYAGSVVATIVKIQIKGQHYLQSMIHKNTFMIIKTIVDQYATFLWFVGPEQDLDQNKIKSTKFLEMIFVEKYLYETKKNTFMIIKTIVDQYATFLTGLFHLWCLNVLIRAIDVNYMVFYVLFAYYMSDIISQFFVYVLNDITL